jgi:hypothetical protein
MSLMGLCIAVVGAVFFTKQHVLYVFIAVPTISAGACRNGCCELAACAKVLFAHHLAQVALVLFQPLKPELI